MAKQLLDAGYGMTEEASEAELIAVNTCRFLESAVQEAIQTPSFQAAEHKRSGKCRMLVAAGCMVQRYGKKLLEDIPKLRPSRTSHSLALKAALGSQAHGKLKAALDRKTGAGCRG